MTVVFSLVGGLAMRVDLCDRLRRLLDKFGPYTVENGTVVCIPSAEHPVVIFGDLDQHDHYRDKPSLQQFIVLSAAEGCAMILSRIENRWHHSLLSGKWASLTLAGVGYTIELQELDL